MPKYQQIIDEIKEKQNITYEQLKYVLEHENESDTEYLFQTARSVADCTFGKNVYGRALIEITNYCKNDCYYCGIRKSNRCIERYRLSKEDILESCEKGYLEGFRTFVLQGGEDGYFTDEKICDIVRTVREKYSDCAITLSIGEKSKESYQKYFDSGADRFLLRHETANDEHYQKLHPSEQKLSARKECLWNLKNIGYQVGCGFMVGSPYQTVETIYEDLCFMKELEPHMIGIGPFIPQKDTPFAEFDTGTVIMTLKLLAVIRLMHPQVLLPATTALSTLHERGRELGILAGANVVMPNFTPKKEQGKYKLYNNKECMGKDEVEASLERIGYTLVSERGDHPTKKVRENV